jgi:hypothetical protein
MQRLRMRLLAPLLAVAALALVPGMAQASGSFIGPFHTISLISSTVPANGDVNPYGTAIVPRSTGKLVAGDVLVSNFNNSNNLQGTGTTLVQIAPDGSFSLFAQIDPTALPGPCPGGVGLTTALTVLRSGFVIVGSLPTTDGQADTARAGCLLILNSHGRVVETISGRPINGPWDLASVDFGDQAVLFVTNVLNGTVAAGGRRVDKGTVVRIWLAIGDIPYVESEQVIGSGFLERTDPNALVIGPTGLGVDEYGTLYVADTLKNRIGAIANALFRDDSAGTGFTISRGGALNGPLGLAIAPNDDILTVNGNDGNIVETTPEGKQIVVKTINPAGAGSLFGLAVSPQENGVYFVDDAGNNLFLLH